MLVKSVLEADLLSFFSNIPTGETATADAASGWANALRTYLIGITPPSIAVNTALSAFESGLFLVFSGDITSILTNMETEFLKLATSIGAGMTGFVPTPPLQPVGFLTLSTQDSAQAAATAWADLIDTWFRTGTAVPQSGGATINWS